MQGRCGTCWTGLIWGYTALSVQCSSTVVQEWWGNGWTA